MRFRALSLVFIVLGMSMLAISMMSEEAQAAPHGVIVIENDTELQAMATAESWPGTGTVADPYLIQDFEIDAQHESNGIRIQSIDLHIVIRNCVIYNTSNGASISSGDGIYLADLDNASIEGCEVYDAFDGIGLFNCKDVNVQNNQLYENRDNGIYIGTSERIGVIENICENNSNSGILVSDSLESNVTLNIVHGNLNHSIAIENSNRTNIEGNSLQGEAQDILLVEASNDCNITRNEIFGAGYDGIDMVDCVGGVISFNTCTQQTNSQISIGNCSGVKLVGNDCDDGPIGIHLTTSTNCSISFGNLTDSTSASPNVAIYLDRSDNTTVADVKISGCQIGIGIDDSDNCSIYGNQIIDCASYGISMASGQDNQFQTNTLIDNNGAGMEYNSSHRQAFDPNPSNHWNSSGAGPGNKWSDWLYPDTDMDGIVDASYILQGGAEDHAPLAVADDKAPVLNLLTPYDAVVINTPYALVSWEGWDNQSGLSGYWLSFDNSSIWVSVGLNTSHLWDPISEGAHSIRVNATDRAGLNTTASHSFTVDRSAPMVTFLSPANNTGTNQSVVTITWEGNDTFTYVVNYMIRLDGRPWTATTNVNFTTPAMEDGWHQFWVNASDLAGNWRIFYQNILVDGTTPTLNITQPTSGGLLGTSTVTVVWTVNDPGSGLDHCLIRLDVGPWIDIGNGTSFEFTGLNEGAHVVHLRAYDELGNVIEKNISFGVDLFAPSVVISSPGNDTYAVGGSTVLNWTGSDSGFGIDHYEVQVDTGTWTNRGINLSWSIISLSDGMHTVRVKAVDHTGRSNITAVTVLVDIVAPTIQIVGPVEGQVLTVLGVNLTWTAEDSGIGLDHYEVQVDGGSWQSRALNVWAILTLVEGHHTAKVRGYDLVGNMGLAWVNFTMDITAPSVIFDYPEEGGLVKNVTTKVFFDVSDISGISWLNYSLDGVNWTALPYPIDNITLQPKDGPVHLTLQATDRAGWQSIAWLNFTVDKTAPFVSDHSPTGNDISPTGVISLRISEELLSGTVTFLVNGQSRNFTVTGNWYNVSLNMAYGHTYVVLVKGGLDLAGNALASYTWSFSIKPNAVISGRVVDSDGRPIIGAFIRVAGMSVTANFQGDFLVSLPPGSYNMTITASGMEERTVPVALTGDQQMGDIVLDPSTGNTDALLIAAMVGVIAVVAIAAFLLVRRRKS